MGEFSSSPRTQYACNVHSDRPLRATQSRGAANREFIAAVHAAEHALTCVLPLFIACDRADTGVIKLLSALGVIKLL
jgi:ATP-dependent helicase YprA (DUF1998 family)